MRTILFLMVVAAMFIGCGPSVTFEEPQPSGVNNESAFNKDYIGLYGCKDDCDSSKLKITSNSVFWVTDFSVAVPIKGMDTLGLRLKGDSLYYDEFSEKAPATVRNDSVFASWHKLDTLFTLDNDHVLRYYKGYYFSRLSLLTQ